MVPSLHSPMPKLKEGVLYLFVYLRILVVQDYFLSISSFRVT